MESQKNVKTEITDIYGEFPGNVSLVFNTRNSEKFLLYSKHADRFLPINLQRLLSPLFLNASIPSKNRSIDFWSTIFMQKNLKIIGALFNNYVTLKFLFSSPTITLHHEWSQDTPLIYTSPDTGTSFIIYPFFEVENKSQRYAPTYEISTQSFKQLNQIVRFKEKIKKLS